MDQTGGRFLRTADRGDSSFYLQLRNLPDVRAQSFNTEVIGLPEHRMWFERKLGDPNTFLFVVEVSSSEPGRINEERVGYMRIQIEGDSGEASVAVVPEHRNRGYATFAIRGACAHLFFERPDVNIVYAHIKPDNVPSLRCFKKAGFRIGGWWITRGIGAWR